MLHLLDRSPVNTKHLNNICTMLPSHVTLTMLPATLTFFRTLLGRGPSVVVSTAAFHARVRGSVLGLGGLNEREMLNPHPRVKLSIVGSLRDR